MTKYISKHPFIFLFSLVLVASCFWGSILTISQPRMALEGTTIPSNAIDTATEAFIVPPNSENTPTGEIPVMSLTPTINSVTQISTNTIIPENTPTSKQLQPSQTTEATNTKTLKQLIVHFINVSQGDSILIISPEGLTMLIDGGSANTGVLAYLRGQGVKRIDLMVATHPHEDHIGGLTQVLNSMPVSRVITNGEAYTTVAYEHFLDAILSSGAEYSEAKRGDTLTLGGLTFSVLNPGGTLGDDPNENSVVLRLVYGTTTFLFMGDAGNISEGSILASGLPVKANILKIGHHGSCTATTGAFVRTVLPNVGIYSAGVDNQYGFPCATTLNTLHQYGVLVLGTDVNGSIIVTVKQDGYRITNSAGKEIGK